MNPQDQRRIVIVDGYSAGRELVRELLERNVECLHLRSSARRPATAGFDATLYDADLGYAGDLDAAIQLLDELGPDAVVAGSERGAMFAELIAHGLNIPANRAESIGDRRLALTRLRLARRPNLQVAGGLAPQFAVNTIFRDGRLFVTDAWRMLLATGDAGLRLGGFQLLDPDLAETEALLAFARDESDRLGIVEGATHTQLAWAADGPALVGAASCLAADPMDGAPYVAAGLTTQASALADLLAGTAHDLGPDVQGYRLARHMTKLLFNFSAPAAIVSLAGLSRLRRLASFHSLYRPLAPGDRVRRGNAWLADGGVVYLVHDEAEQISADARQFRLLESRGELYGLAPLADGALL
ncbi:MAG: hypothetical protein WDM85_04835 [Caulobacteraceae bacterium]